MAMFHLLKIRTSVDIFKNEKCKVTFGLEYTSNVGFDGNSFGSDCIAYIAKLSCTYNNCPAKDAWIHLCSCNKNHSTDLSDSSYWTCKDFTDLDSGDGDGQIIKGLSHARQLTKF